MVGCSLCPHALFLQARSHFIINYFIIPDSVLGVLTLYALEEMASLVNLPLL